MEAVTIQIKPATRELLKDAGSKRETYDDVINRLLDFWNEQHVEKPTIKYIYDEYRAKGHTHDEAMEKLRPFFELNAALHAEERKGGGGSTL